MLVSPDKVMFLNRCGRTVQNNTLTEALIFHQTLSTPKASYNERILSGTPQGRARKIHIFPQGSNNENELQHKSISYIRVLEKYIITIPNTEFGMINSGILKDTSSDKITRISSEPTRRILHTRYSSSITCNRGK